MLLFLVVLKVNLTDGAERFAYPDDLALLVTAKNEEGIIYRANESFWCIALWMRSRRLELVVEKTVAVILKGKRRNRPAISFKIVEAEVTPKKKICYLGITLDEDMSFHNHITKAVGLAEGRASQASRLMPNIGGLSSSKSRLLCLWGRFQMKTMFNKHGK